MNRARTTVAHLSFHEARALFTAMCCLIQDLASARRCTDRASLRTNIPFAERGHHTIDRAGLSVAGTLLRKHRARNTTVSDVDLDSTRAALGATAARQAACRPGRPLTDDAVHRTGLSVALARLSESGALLAAVSNTDANATGTALGATAAAEAARRPGRPRRYNAVNGAGVVVARLLLGEQRASVAAVLSMSYNTAATSLGSTAASKAAGSPLRESRNLAVDGARTIGAALLLAEHGASNTAESDGGLDGARTLLGSSSASHGASRPGSPTTDNTVNRAGMLIAMS